ncbi:MAG: hypothetical protein DRI92_05600, partial [Aquificota bacterium]
VSKLDRFASMYQGIEPECARNHNYGYRVKVTEITRNDKDVGDVWEFGANEFSFGDALKNKFELWIPVALRYDEETVGIGKMEIEIYDGELEALAGFIDWACMLGKLGRYDRLSARIHASYPIVLNESGYLCINTKSKKACRRLLCRTYFKGIMSPGTYMITTEFAPPGKVMVRT